MSLNRISPPAKARAHAHTYTHAPTRNLYHTHLKEAIKWVTTAWINNESKIADLVTGADPWSNFTAGVTFRLRSRNLLSGTDLNSGFHLQSNTASYLSHEYPRWSRWRSTKLSVTLTRVWVIDGRAATSHHDTDAVSSVWNKEAVGRHAASSSCCLSGDNVSLDENLCQS